MRAISSGQFSKGKWYKATHSVRHWEMRTISCWCVQLRCKVGEVYATGRERLGLFCSGEIPKLEVTLMPDRRGWVNTHDESLGWNAVPLLENNADLCVGREGPPNSIQ